MKSDNELLDLAKQFTGSDTATGKLLGMKQGQMSDARYGRRALSAAQAAQIAEMVGINWLEEAFPRLAAKEKSYKSGRFWLGKLPKLREIGRKAATVAFLAMIPLLGANVASLPFDKSASPTCILCKVPYM